MTLKQAQSMIEELGHIYAVALAERGHNVDGKTPVMNGLAAYYMLNLKGEIEELDESVDEIVGIIYEKVRRKLSPIGIGE